MAKNVSSSAEGKAKRAAPGADGLLESALRCFYQYGYAGTSVRQIASDAHVTVAALYHHFESKQEMLVSIMTSAMEAALNDAQAAYESAEPVPAEQLKALVAAMVRYHTRHQTEAFVGNSELRSLEKPHRSDVIALRDAHEAIMRKVISDGVADGSFHVEQPERASRAVIAMCIAVASWDQKGGSLTPTDISDLYSQYALNLVGYRAKTSSVRRGASART
jgi:AcrR family transcriptional regulator